MHDIVADIICREYQEVKGEAFSKKAMTFTFSMNPNYKNEWHDDYYPKLTVTLWSPGNYTKVLIQESDPHHFGSGPLVKVGDHDSCWRESVRHVLGDYKNAIRGIELFDGWRHVIDADPEAFTLPHGKNSDARFLPEVRGLKEPESRPKSIYKKVRA